MIYYKLNYKIDKINVNNNYSYYKHKIIIYKNNYKLNK